MIMTRLPVEAKQQQEEDGDVSSLDSWGPCHSVAMTPESLHLHQRVDVPGYEDEEVLPEPATPASRDPQDRLDAAARRRRAQQRRVATLLQKDSKFGRCKVHGTKMMPHLVKTGVFAGTVKLYCSRWFRFQKSSYERCWEDRPLTSRELALLPPVLREEYGQIKASLARGRMFGRCS